MLLWLDQIEKARARSEGIDLRGLAIYAKDKTPGELGTPIQLSQRASFLRESLGDEEKSSISFERIIAGSEIQDVNYLARGARAAKAVARIEVHDTSGRLEGYGSGFLIAPGVLITNNHVLPTDTISARSRAQFEFEYDIDGRPLNAVTYALEPARLFFTSKQLDFSVVAVSPQPLVGEGALGHYGFLPLVGATGKVSDGEWLTIVQHPNGDRKQVCVRENKLLKRTDDVLWYSTDTLGGSSGSPAFSNDWYVVALHHSGVPEEKDGRIQTVAGTDFDAMKDGEQDIKWVANEGIRVSRIVETLQAALPTHPLLQPIFSATPENARLVVPSVSLLAAVASPVPDAADRLRAMPRLRPDMKELPVNDISASPRTVTVTLRIDEQGVASVLQQSAGAAESTFAAEAARARTARPPAFDVPFDVAYANRSGFDERFLDAAKPALSVDLPQLSAALKQETAKLVAPAPANTDVLHYDGYSLVMHEKRRLAIYSAANVDFAGRYELARPADVWRQDPRIAAAAQLTSFYYEKNQFDRGHLTRREDMEYGATRQKALTRAADTCHWTNCTPQHAKFNQGKALWQGIERYLFEDGVELAQFKAQVITGPILEESDPVWDRYPKIQYPLRFWKVVAAVTASGKLFATAYILDQSEVIAQFGIEVDREVPFGAYKTFQVPIREIELLTQLTFSGGVNGKVALRDVDPLSLLPAKKVRAARTTLTESMRIDIPDGWLPLESWDTIVLPA